MKRSKLVALVAVGALAVAACGGDDDDSGAEAESTAESTAEATEEMTEESAEMSDETTEDMSEDMSEEMTEEMADGGHSTVDIDGILAADLDNCAEAPTGDPIRVGMAMDFSDVVGFVDIPGSNLVPYVAELANCAGGINGAPVEVRVAVGTPAEIQAHPHVRAAYLGTSTT